MQDTHTPDFRIQLEDDNVILRGSSDESAGVMLRGYIILDCHKNMKIKSISLNFIGKINVHWTEGRGSHQKHHKAERVVVSNDWVFLPAKKKSYNLCKGQYKWYFEFPLPGNLPESIAHEMGQVTYDLHAICERPTFFQNYVDKKPLKVTRLMLPTSLELSEQVVITSVWANKLMYDINIPTKVFSAGKMVPITFDLTPIAPNLKVQSIFCALKEYTTCSTPDSQVIDGKTISNLKDDRIVFDQVTGKTLKTEILRVPSDYHRVRFDTSGELLSVKHKIKFTVSLQNEDGHISELRADIPVVIAPINLEEDLNALPSYEDAWHSIPYDPYTQDQIYSTDNTSKRSNTPPCRSSSFDSCSSMSSSSTLSASPSSLHEDHIAPVLWMGMDICRVPSYTTALHTANIPCQNMSSLPTYDSITIV